MGAWQPHPPKLHVNVCLARRIIYRESSKYFCLNYTDSEKKTPKSVSVLNKYYTDFIEFQKSTQTTFCKDLSLCDVVLSFMSKVRKGQLYTQCSEEVLLLFCIAAFLFLT